MNMVVPVGDEERQGSKVVDYEFVCFRFGESLQKLL